ncbi:unnamed protein product [Malus baccata var. baccata]
MQRTGNAAMLMTPLRYFQVPIKEPQKGPKAREGGGELGSDESFRDTPDKWEDEEAEKGEKGSGGLNCRLFSKRAAGNFKVDEEDERDEVRSVEVRKYEIDRLFVVPKFFEGKLEKNFMVHSLDSGTLLMTEERRKALRDIYAKNLTLCSYKSIRTLIHSVSQLLASGSETAAMESIPLGHSISATNQSFLLGRQRNPENQFQSSSQRFHLHTPTRRFRIHSKLSGFQDSKGYARPSRLLPATEVKICTDNSVEKLFSSLRDDGSRSLYKVKLGTSNVYGSSLSDLNAGILLCVIDENGDSILQRIPSSIITNHATESEDGVLHFQRGSVDEFTFEGPKLGKVGAVWISLESGQWRLGSVSLTVICGKQSSLEEKDEEKLQYTGFSYNFAVENILLGEGSDSSMVQLRPCLVTELSGVDPVTIFTKGLPESTLPVSGISNEETMREYEDLKLSLLLYDAMLIFVGTSVASFSAGENISFAFLTGGMGGFFYLLLLQRSVDGLPAAELTSTNIGQTNQTFGGSKVPIFVFALAIGFTLLTVKYGSGDVPIVFTPKQLIAGMIGFLACKVSVVLAAVKPLPISLKINE